MILDCQNRTIIILIFAILFIWNVKSTAQQADHIAGDLIVMMKPGTDPSMLLRDFSTFDSLNPALEVKKQLSKRMNIWLLHFNSLSVDENKFLTGITSSSLVTMAQFNHYIQSRNIPNDTEYGQQWNMLNIGQVINGQAGTPGADVQATSAWDITTGGLTAAGDTIVIAIDDDGFDLTHEDLNYWKNHKEIPGNNIDDDENGYTDDYDGWNAKDSSGNITSSDHGTHVAGIAGAKGNNGIGIAGVNWNVQIMPVQGNSGVESVAVEGYGYILEMRARYNESQGEDGAFVVSANSSWGTDFAQPANFPIWCAMYDSMGHYGILNAAATNNSSNVNVDVQSDMPTACASDYLIAVTNTDKNDQRVAAFGATTIDLGAPGTSIISTVPGNQYSLKTGTSMASPHVAGAVALLFSLPCAALATDLKNDPAGTALRIKNFILAGVDTSASLADVTVSGGRLNVNQALLNAATYYNCSVGIDEALAVNDVLVFPNPATDVINIIKGKSMSVRAFQLINFLGEKIIESDELDSSFNSYQIGVSALSKGIYFLNIEIENGQPFTVKVVVK